MSMRIVSTGILAVAALGLAVSTAAAQSLERIKQRGTLIVGVKADYKPFGFRDPQGNIVGLEADLAKDVADALGVKLELVPVVSSNRMQFLQQGKIDLMIATMNDTPERQKIVGIVDPDYYASGVNVFAVKSAKLAKWDDLKGKNICAIQGAWYNKMIAEKYGAEIVAFKGTAEAETALAQGNCIGWVYDDTAFYEKLDDKAKYADYEMPLPSISVAPWGLAVPLEERDKAFGRFMSGMVYQWLKSGRLGELEAKWHIPKSEWVVQMHDRLNKPLDLN